MLSSPQPLTAIIVVVLVVEFTVFWCYHLHNLLLPLLRLFWWLDSPYFSDIISMTSYCHYCGCFGGWIHCIFVLSSPFHPTAIIVVVLVAGFTVLWFYYLHNLLLSLLRMFWWLYSPYFGAIISTTSYCNYCGCFGGWIDLILVLSSPQPIPAIIEDVLVTEFALFV